MQFLKCTDINMGFLPGHTRLMFQKAQTLKNNSQKAINICFSQSLTSYINPRKNPSKMSDNVPFDIQMEIIKKVYDVKSLIRFRSVSKPWKSFIDSSEFIKGYGTGHTQPRSLIFMCKAHLPDVARRFCFVDADSETFEVHQQEFAPTLVVSPLLKQCRHLEVVDASHGLLCFKGFHEGYKNWMVVIWNPSIRKSFGIAAAPVFDTQTYIIWTVYGFGVCPVTSDPTVVKVSYTVNKHWHAEVFTLSSGVWNVIPSGNLPRQSVELRLTTPVAIDRFIYWGAHEKTFTDDGESTTDHMVMSFDLITKEFKVVDLPYSLRNYGAYLSVSKLRESLVVYGCIVAGGAIRCGVWVMEHDSSLRKLYTIGASVSKLLGFKKNGETIFETRKDRWFNTLNVYDPCSQKIKDLGISGEAGSFFMGSYKESLLLLNHLDSRIYDDNNLSLCSKGWAVRPLKRYVSWVQNVMRQFGHISRGLFCS